MFIVYYHYLLYQAGDENYDLNQLVSASLPEYQGFQSDEIRVSPNPFSEGSVTLSFEEVFPEGMQVLIYNSQGLMVRDLSSNIVSVEHQLFWNGLDSENSPCAPGLYYVSANRNGKFFSAKLVKH